MAAPELSTAIPSVEMVLVDRHRKVTSVWYPFLQRLSQFIDGVATGELIVDGAIISRTIATGAIVADGIAAGAVTADAMAANSITAGNAAIGTAAVDTLQIAGNAVTQAVSVTTPTQTLISSTSYTTVASTSMSLSGTQPILVWGALMVSGVHSPPWTNNTTNTFVDAQITVGGSTAAGVSAMTIQPGIAHSVPFASVFTGIGSGSTTVAVKLRKSSGGSFEDFAYRDVTLAALETKR